MKIIENSLEGIKEAAEILTSNGIVAFPTETVYGLGANAFSKEAVTKFSSPLSGKNLPFSSLSEKLGDKKNKDDE